MNSTSNSMDDDDNDDDDDDGDDDAHIVFRLLYTTFSNFTVSTCSCIHHHSKFIFLY